VIIALIPGYNEAPRIGQVVVSALTHLPVYVVDDGSTDGTADRARAAGAIVIVQRPNQGKGAALRAGFRRLLDDGADAILTLDADGQHDPIEIPRFLEAWGAGSPEPPRTVTGGQGPTRAVTGPAPRPDLVIGRRSFRSMPPVRRLSNEVGRVALSWAVGRDIPDNQSGYRLVSRRLAEATLASDEAGFAFEVEQITTCIRMGGTIGWVPIRTIYAGAPSHIRPLAHLREFVRIVRRARRDVRTPLG
jgi:glycosyltransferase involved in cell wall biosynthesis